MRFPGLFGENVSNLIRLRHFFQLSRLGIGLGWRNRFGLERYSTWNGQYLIAYKTDIKQVIWWKNQFPTYFCLYLLAYSVILAIFPFFLIFLETSLFPELLKLGNLQKNSKTPIYAI